MCVLVAVDGQRRVQAVREVSAAFDCLVFPCAAVKSPQFETRGGSELARVDAALIEIACGADGQRIVPTVVALGRDRIVLTDTRCIDRKVIGVFVVVIVPSEMGGVVMVYKQVTGTVEVTFANDLRVPLVTHFIGNGIPNDTVNFIRFFGFRQAHHMQATLRIKIERGFDAASDIIDFPTAVERLACIQTRKRHERVITAVVMVVITLRDGPCLHRHHKQQC